MKKPSSAYWRRSSTPSPSFRRTIVPCLISPLRQVYHARGLDIAVGVGHRGRIESTKGTAAMTHLPSLPANAALFDLFKAYPEVARPLLAYHEVLLRGPSSLSVPERERIAAYVSGLNGCAYCQAIHGATARALQSDQGEDDDKTAPIFALVEKLTLSPDADTAAEAEAVLAAGWDEEALFHSVSICALFSLMNRLVAGLGIAAGPDYLRMAAERLAEGGYAGLAAKLDPR